MEYWSIETSDIKPLAITPILRIYLKFKFSNKDYLVLVYRTVLLYILVDKWALLK